MLLITTIWNERIFYKRFPAKKDVPTAAIDQCPIRAARALIRWSAEDLANHCAVSVTTIRRAELMPSTTALTRVNDYAIRRASKRQGSNSSMLIKAAQECGCGRHHQLNWFYQPRAKDGRHKCTSGR